MKSLIIVLSLTIVISSCSQNSKAFDKNGSLLVENLTSMEGGFNFVPMSASDSADVLNYTPVVYKFEDEPYTGKIASYNKEKLMLEGYLKNGILSGEWKFYYPSGVIQIEGTYTNGHETGFWKSYYTKDKPNIVKYYNKDGLMLMRKEYYDTGKIKNYQNINCEEFGGRERRIQFKYNGEIDYIDAEREVGKLTPAEINTLLKNDGLLVK